MESCVLRMMITRYTERDLCNKEFGTSVRSNTLHSLILMIADYCSYLFFFKE